MFYSILIAFIIMAVAYVAANTAERVLKHVSERDGNQVDIFNLLASVAKYGILTVGAIMALSNLGIDVTAIVAGLGLTGFALGFALKDALSNVLAGAMLIAYKPFEDGDEISVDGVTGRVTSLDLRYTTLVGDGETYLVPNSVMFAKTVKLKRREVHVVAEEIVEETPKPKAKAKTAKKKSSTKK